MASSSTSIRGWTSATSFTAISCHQLTNPQNLACSLFAFLNESYAWISSGGLFAHGFLHLSPLYGHYELRGPSPPPRSRRYARQRGESTRDYGAGFVAAGQSAMGN